MLERCLRTLSWRCTTAAPALAGGRCFAMLLGRRGVTAPVDCCPAGLLLPSEGGSLLLQLLRDVLDSWGPGRPTGRGHRSGVTLPEGASGAAAACGACAGGDVPAAAIAAATRSDGVRLMPGWLT